MNEYAVVDYLKLTEIPGANTLQLGEYNGLHFAVDKNIKATELCLIFFPDGQLSEEYATANDCISRTDENGNKAGGFFGKNRKVRSMSFMKGKVKSMGYVSTLDSLKFTGVDIASLKPGTFISTVNGIPIVNKFLNEATTKARNANTKNKKSSKKVFIGFPEHQDTKQYYQNKNDFLPGDIITITEKLDGTSVRFGKPFLKSNLTGIKKFINKFIPLCTAKETPLIGTRHTVLDTIYKRDTGFYKNDSIYVETPNIILDKIKPGEVIYAEIVGWQTENKPLFTRGDVKFIYGCFSGTRKLYVYKILWSLLDGSSIQLPWAHLKHRCEELGLSHVPEIKQIILPYDEKDLQTVLYDLHNNIVPNATVGKSYLDQSHIKEGCVLRIDRDNTTFYYKSKSEEYYLLEDKFKANENNVDLEEIN